MPTFADKTINFFTRLKSPSKFPSRIGILNPYEKKEVKDAVKEFYKKFYSDEQMRIYVLGINPGRFGGGLTGISFTDPVALKKHCGIDNPFGNREELSSKFVYEVINRFGGANKFFSNFFLSAIYPLALIKDGQNYNYYNDKKLYLFLKSHLISSLKEQIKFGADRKVVICLGKKNAEYLKIMNDELKLFGKIETLDHPRFIMQYKRKKIELYLEQYIKTFSNAKGS